MQIGVECQGSVHTQELRPIPVMVTRTTTALEQTLGRIGHGCANGSIGHHLGGHWCKLRIVHGWLGLQRGQVNRHGAYIVIGDGRQIAHHQTHGACRNAMVFGVPLP